MEKKMSYRKLIIMSIICIILILAFTLYLLSSGNIHREIENQTNLAGRTYYDYTEGINYVSIYITTNEYLFSELNELIIQLLEPVFGKTNLRIMRKTPDINTNTEESNINIGFLETNVGFNCCNTIDNVTVENFLSAALGVSLSNIEVQIVYKK